MSTVTHSAPRLRTHWTDRLAHIVLIGVVGLLLIGLLGPLLSILAQSLQPVEGKEQGGSAFAS